ncbi:hypothetical protein HK105_202750 [Polyrhizophydium stewartii]|uniref:Protein kinase domain-containing protein n=1 Tax=Polyrhizophydium stewartii TaxID=2732419 RepID=A0ABR4NEH6_9FUNG
MPQGAEAREDAGALTPPEQTTAAELAVAVERAAAVVVANHAAAAALARRSAQAAAALDGRLAASEGDTPRRLAAALRTVLADAERFLKKTATRNKLQQALLAHKTAEQIGGLWSQLEALCGTLKLGISPDDSELAAATAQDAADLAVLVEQLVAATGTTQVVPSQQLETLLAINQHQGDLASALPEPLQAALAQLLSRVALDIIASAGRGLSAPQDWSVDPDDVDIFWLNKIGRGGFGEVFRGRWEGRDVAVKVLNGARGSQSMAAIEKEAAVWLPLHHPNVLRPWRVCINVDEPFIVMPLMRGDVMSFLATHQDAGIDVRTGFLLGIARGMQYLHERQPPIIHGDLKANNVLIDKEGDVFITDFGLAFIKTSTSADTSRRGGALRWIAPEKYKRGYKLAPPYDVFSFAMTALHILTGQVPFSEETQDEVVAMWIRDGERPDRPDGVPDVLWSVICDCWIQDPARRPTFREIVRRLHVLPVAMPSDDPSLADSLAARLAGLQLEQGQFDFSSASSSIPRSIQAFAKTPMASYFPPSIPQTPVVSTSDNMNSDDSGIEPSVSTTQDIDVLLEALPGWCSRKGINHSNFLRFDETVTYKNETFPILRWNIQDRLTVLALIDQAVSGELSPRIGGLLYLQELWLSDNGITELPDSVGKLLRLKKLCVEENNLVTLPESIHGLTKLVDLIASSNQIEALPDWIGRLSRLVTLDMSDNRLTSLPEAICKLAQLQRLILASNSLKSLPTSTPDFTRLEEMVLTSNELTELPRWLGVLTRLTKLDASNNRITSLPETMGTMIQLAELVLKSNQISSLPDGLGRLGRLRKLDISSNNISVVPDAIGELRQLTFLDLSDNRISTLPASMSNLWQLKDLVLYTNQFTRIPEAIKDMRNLSVLDLGINQITGVPDWLGGMPELTMLYLGDNHLTELPESLGNLSKLAMLQLWDNQLVELPESFGQLTQLTSLRVEGNQLSKLPKSLARIAGLRISLSNNTASPEQLRESMRSE